jgi:hypothetical protein
VKTDIHCATDYLINAPIIISVLVCAYMRVYVCSSCLVFFVRLVYAGMYRMGVTWCVRVYVQDGCDLVCRCGSRTGQVHQYEAVGAADEQLGRHGGTDTDERLLPM